MLGLILGVLSWRCSRFYIRHGIWRIEDDSMCI